MSEASVTTSTMLFNHLFEACNILRGPINQDEYKTYVIPILFFKRISDTYDEETAQAIEEYGEDVDDFDEDELHTFIIPSGCHWNDIRVVSENVGLAIVNAMVGIERANPDTLGGLFSSFDDANWTDKNKLSDARLKDLVEHMSKLKVGNNDYSADVMGDAYEFLIKKFADLSKKNAGEFYTPRPIVKLMIQILNPQAGETIYDPACGTGGMLIEGIRHVGHKEMTYGRIYGQEKNLATSAIARMNLFLHGARDFKITQGDTLRSPNFVKGGALQTFDCVVANPPFSLKNWGSKQFGSDIYGRNIWGCPTDSNGDFAWLQHMYKSMRPGKGRCAVVMPQGVLFRNQGKEKDIRRQMVESGLVEAVFTLGEKLFYGTGLSPCFLVMRRTMPTNHSGRILMVDGSSIFTPKRAQNVLEQKDIERLYQLYVDYRDEEDYSRVVTLDDVRAKDYILSPSSYVQYHEEEEEPYESVRQRFMDAYEEMKRCEREFREAISDAGK